jgi:uncharacterized protein with von Willebrand factor type A (vWA) domain
VSEVGEAREVDEVLVGFTRALRAAGLRITQDRVHGYLSALSTLGLADAGAAHLAGRATLCSSPEDLARYDQVFEAYFNARDGLPRTRPATRPSRTWASLPIGDDGADDAADPDDGLDQDEVIRAMASDAEVLRHRDVADLSAAERDRIAALLRALPARHPRRRTTRSEPWRRGRVDASRTLRASLRRMGEPAQVRWRRRGHRPRRVVLLVDVSGSMNSYADPLLRLAHRMSQAGPVETFTIGTRLTHVTRAMRSRDPERAMAAAAETVPDWSGGTRLGENLRVFLDRWGRRGMARGAVVVIFSDGWERGDAGLLGDQMALLGRLAHRVVWVNPHRGKTGYEPVQGGIAAALPHCDEFLAGHSLSTYAELVEVVARA